MTTGDWDFSTTDWELTTDLYVSEPSSLTPTVTAVLRVLIKTTTVPIVNVKEGRVIFSAYMNRDAVYSIRVPFRYQDDGNTYRVEIQLRASPNGKVKVVRVGGVGGSATLKEEINLDFPLNTWHKFRVTWWNDYVGLVVRVEHYEDAEWVIIIEAYDAENNWKDVGGRVGHMLMDAGAFIDDTYIYGLPP